MSLFISSLNSGSNGNCYYIGNHEEAILVDAGIPCREVERRMKQNGLSLKLVKAVFISHEHTDHIRGLEVLSRKHQLPVYITPATETGGHLRIEAALVRRFTAYEPVSVGGLTVMPFPKFHDAVDPHSFTVSGNGLHIGVFTDIGAPCNHLAAQLQRCHAAFLEANYDEEMLEKGRYPFFLKRRISGGQGHLSNRQALELFLAHRAPHLTHLLLSHLSQDNNRPELALEMFQKHAGGTQVVVASRYGASAVYEITANAAVALSQATGMVGAPVALSQPAMTPPSIMSTPAAKAAPRATQTTLLF